MVERGCQRPQVGGRGHGTVERLGRHVGDGAEQAALHRELARLLGSRDPEVGELRFGELVQQDVVGLDVTVHDARVVCGGQRPAQLHPDVEHLWHVEAGGGGDATGPVPAVEERHHDVPVARLGGTGGVDGDDVGMAGQSAKDATLPFEAADVLLAGPRVVQHLDRDLALEVDLPRPIDRPEGARTDLGQPLEPSQLHDEDARPPTRVSDRGSGIRWCGVSGVDVPTPTT